MVDQDQDERNRTMKAIDVTAAVLLVIGGLNWGVWGLFDVDVVASVLGGYSSLAARSVYVIVGAAAVYQALNVKAIQSRWKMAST